ncbi:MAG: hypothetical protein KJ000_33120 [Pirellulaceae bacterium]|nr:hypothetical protein [Pirellulaceae bacterium]
MIQWPEKHSPILDCLWFMTYIASEIICFIKPKGDPPKAKTFHHISRGQSQMSPRQNERKTLYILGAGFSSPAGGPRQDAILKTIISLPERGEVASKRKRLLEFLTKTLEIPESKIGGLSLEDLYTPIDRCLADRVSLRGKTSIELEEVRSALDYLISMAIREAFDGPWGDRQYVDKFARFLVNRAAKRAELAKDATTSAKAKEYDPFSIISLNWDILLDNALDRALQEKDRGSDFGDYDSFGVVDYCCYVSSLKRENSRIRSGLWSLGCRGYNVKMLKIHGSMNWLQCTNCQRLFTSFDEKLVVSEHIGNPCRHCKKNGITAKLRGSLVMPTFLKDLSNFQIKLVWQNAGVELMEARRLIFIGYSLPHADFEFRQLLSRMVHNSASIHVVLWRDDHNPEPYNGEVRRYRQFFSRHRLTFEPMGVQRFVDEHLQGQD